MNPAGARVRSHGGWRRESAFVATAFTVCLLGGVFQVDGTVSAPRAATYIVAALSCAMLPLRHRAPRAAIVGVTLAAMMVAPLGLLLTPLSIAPAVIVAYAFAVRAERGTTITVLATCSTLMVIVTPLFGALSWQDLSRLGSVAAFPLVAGILGHASKNRRDYVAAVEDRAIRAEETRDSEALRRVVEERLRIARDLHDVVAHQITLANAQAAVAVHLFSADPAQSRTSLIGLVDTTRDALDGLRATVGLLRQSGDTGDPTDPVPGLWQLPALFASFRGIGLAVSMDQEGSVRVLPPGVDLTAYRIVQEALTNVSKHSDCVVARLHLAWLRDRLTITVADDGSDAQFTTPMRPQGYGLIGMRERAAAVGGVVAVRIHPDGGFIVTATLPFSIGDDSVRRNDASDGTS